MRFLLAVLFSVVGWAQYMPPSGGGSSGVTTFNTRSGAVTLTSGDVTTALGYTPPNASLPLSIANGGIGTTSFALANLAQLGTANAGDLIFTDATYDIGKSGATRPRDLFASRNGVFGTSLSTPLYTASGSIIFQPGADSTTAFRFQNQAGNATILTIDSTGKVVTVSGPNSTTLFAVTDSSNGKVLFDVAGNDLNSGSYIRTGDVRVFTTLNYTVEPLRMNGPSSRLDMNANTYLAWYATTGSISGAPQTVLSQISAGLVGFGTTGQGSTAGSFSGTNGTLSGILTLSTLTTPADNATCTAGTLWVDTGFIYVCTASGTVKRATLATY